MKSSHFILWMSLATRITRAWKNCSSGGGVCPSFATCCETGEAGVSACITSRHAKDPDSSGTCCDSKTGCGYGFYCDLRGDHNDEPYCRLDRTNPPEDIFHDQPRYQLCTIPSAEMQTLYGFPISNTSSPQLAYHSNMGPITKSNTKHLNVQKVLIIIHGSGRNADDYFCLGLSLIPETEHDNVLVIVPKFLAPEDEILSSNHQFLIWQDRSNQYYPLGHSWRYGANAINAPISSYETLDQIVEYLLATAPLRFPNLKLISLAGHSAGGQVVHRWALLSNSLAWRNPHVEVRAIAANPRSYCYLDKRRLIPHHDIINNSTKMVFETPSKKSVDRCPDYNAWNWGLGPGGDLNVPYKDTSLQITPAHEMAMRYAYRNVVYLTGENDLIVQNDHCATFEFQGRSRHERAIYYYKALKDFYEQRQAFGQELYTIPESPHDHFLMLQSEAGRKAIFDDTFILARPNSFA